MPTQGLFRAQRLLGSSISSAPSRQPRPRGPAGLLRIEHRRDRADQPAAWQGHPGQAAPPRLAELHQAIEGQLLQGGLVWCEVLQVQFHIEVAHHCSDQAAALQHAERVVGPSDGGNLGANAPA